MAMFREQSSARILTTRARLATALTNAATTAGPPLFFGLRFWASICLALYISFWLQLDNAYWAGITAALVHQPHLGASLRKVRFYLIGTLVGAAIAVVLAGWFPQDPVAFLVALASVGAASAFASALLRNFASYGAALAGITVAVIAGDTLGATGGLNGEVFTLAVARASEICVGIVCSGLLLAATDLGGARRRLSELFAALLAEITVGFTGTLALAGSERSESHSTLRELARRTIALDPVIDQRLREIARATMQTQHAAQAGTPSLRLLADQTAKVLAGTADALNALAPVTDVDTQADRRPRRARLHVPDWLPAFVNAGRAFVAIAAVALFWIVTAWPNGAVAITLAAVVVIMFAPRGD